LRSCAGLGESSELEWGSVDTAGRAELAQGSRAELAMGSWTELARAEPRQVGPTVKGLREGWRVTGERFRTDDAACGVARGDGARAQERVWVTEAPRSRTRPRWTWIKASGMRQRAEEKRETRKSTRQC
jgi:hypothetical protein